MKTVGVIPARLKSTRFPGKPLVSIAGVPMVIRVAQKVAAALGNESTYVATDDEHIRQVCGDYGVQALMTSTTCKTGTDRISEFARQVEADIYLNIQGDEPLVAPEDILSVAKAKQLHMQHVTCGMCPLEEDEDPENINIPKVLVSKTGELIYASRYPIPAVKDKKCGTPAYLKQVCIYGFSKQELELFSGYSAKAYGELYEDIEILRFLDAGVKVMMVLTKRNTIAVDIPSDVSKVENRLLEERLPQMRLVS